MAEELEGTLVLDAETLAQLPGVGGLPTFCLVAKAFTSSPQSLLLANRIRVVACQCAGSSGAVVSRTGLANTNIPNNSFQLWPQIVAVLNVTGHITYCSAEFQAGDRIYVWMGGVSDQVYIYFSYLVD